MRLRAGVILKLSKAYVALALVMAAIFSPLAYSLVPVSLLAWYIYLWRRRFNVFAGLLTDLYAFLAVAVLLAPVASPFISLLISFPALVSLTYSLKNAAGSLSYRESNYDRAPTGVSVSLAIAIVSTLTLALLLGSLPLLLASTVLFIYFGILAIFVIRCFPIKPVDEKQLEVRMLAGSEDTFEIKLEAKTASGGRLFIESPYDWLKVFPPSLSLDKDNLSVKLSLSPKLAGTWKIRLNGRAVDRFGLMQTGFALEPVILNVIPRARYAAWLAQKYLAETGPGSLPLPSDIRAMKTIYGVRSGVDYFGSRLYQPGDSLKNIDLKRTIKFHVMITKEYAEFHGQPAVVLVNLAVGSAEEADKLAYNIIVTALSLAREGIPTALAAYNQDGVAMTTTALDPAKLVTNALKLAQEMVTTISGVKYLNPPDVKRLRADITRLRLAESNASKKLLGLLELEYRGLYENAKGHPATKALNTVFAKADKQSSVVVISCRNHDTEALAFNAFNLVRRGNAVITV